MRIATPRVVKALGVTLEVTGSEMSKEAMKVVLHQLAAFPETQVCAALTRCTLECKGRLTLADVITRIDDGRPGPEEAWAAIPKDEAASVVWTVEMRDAYAAARALINADDLVAARMTFLEKYRISLAQARIEERPIRWEFSPGFDKSGRELALLDAVEKKRLTAADARDLLPHHREDEGLNARLLALAGGAFKRIEAPKT